MYVRKRNKLSTCIANFTVHLSGCEQVLKQDILHNFGYHSPNNGYMVLNTNDIKKCTYSVDLAKTFDVDFITLHLNALKIADFWAASFFNTRNMHASNLQVYEKYSYICTQHLPLFSIINALFDKVENPKL